MSYIWAECCALERASSSQRSPCERMNIEAASPAKRQARSTRTCCARQQVWAMNICPSPMARGFILPGCGNLISAPPRLACVARPRATRAA